MLQATRLKQGELSTTTMIVLVLGILFLTILLVVFAQRADLFQKSWSALMGQSSSLCSKAGGICSSSASCPGNVKEGSFADCPAPSVCCT